MLLRLTAWALNWLVFTAFVVVTILTPTSSLFGGRAVVVLCIISGGEPVEYESQTPLPVSDTEAPKGTVDTNDKVAEFKSPEELLSQHGGVDQKKGATDGLDSSEPATVELTNTAAVKEEVDQSNKDASGTQPITAPEVGGGAIKKEERNTAGETSDPNPTENNATGTDGAKSINATPESKDTPDTPPEDVPLSETVTAGSIGEPSADPSQTDPTLAGATSTPSPSTETPPVGVDLSEHDMPAFADWRKEHENHIKTNGGTPKAYNGASSDRTKPSSISRSGSLRNYASVKCNAKVKSTNSEVSNAQAVLNEDNDDYLVQPCSAKKKFLVIELCEAIAVKKIEIGNLEYFSSTIQNFTLSISRHNNKDQDSEDWQVIGSFRAKDERTAQSFDVDYVNIYTLFVKLEISSYHGTEHYCPITIIRVHGYSVDDDDGDEEHHNPPPQATTSTPAANTTAEVLTTSTASPTTVVPEEKETDFTFPPQLDVCYRCYDDLSSVPLYCLPESYELLPDGAHTAADAGRAKVKDSENSQTSSGTEAEVSKGTVKPQAEAVATSDKDNKTAAVESSANQSPAHVSSQTGAESNIKTGAIPALDETDSNTGNTEPAAITASELPPPLVEETTQTPDSVTLSNEQGADQLSSTPPDEVVLEQVLPSPPTLAEPPTAAPVVEVQELTTPSPPAATDEGVPEEQEGTGSSQDPPPPATRPVIRNTAIGTLKNQVRSLEKNLNVTNTYLEEMSEKYKNQKDYLQRVLNQTMWSLKNLTMKLDNLTREIQSLKIINSDLSRRVTKLEEEKDKLESPLASLVSVVVAGLFILTLLQISNCLKPKTSTLTREEIIQMIADMPNQPIRGGLRRSDSMSGAVGHVSRPSGAPGMKRAKSYAAMTGEGGADSFSNSIRSQFQEVEAMQSYNGDIEVICPTLSTAGELLGDHVDKPKKKRKKHKKVPKAGVFDLSETILESSDQSPVFAQHR